MERARKRGWNLIALDRRRRYLDPRRAQRMMASVLATFAQFERRLIGQRTKDARKKANGVKLGRPRTMSEETVERIRELQRLGMSHSDIAREPNAEGIPTATVEVAGIRPESHALCPGCVRIERRLLGEGFLGRHHAHAVLGVIGADVVHPSKTQNQRPDLRRHSFTSALPRALPSRTGRSNCLTVSRRSCPLVPPTWVVLRDHVSKLAHFASFC